jgi:hypothetical protein
VPWTYLTDCTGGAGANPVSAAAQAPSARYIGTQGETGKEGDDETRQIDEDRTIHSRRPWLMSEDDAPAGVPKNGAIAGNPCHMKLNKSVSIDAASVIRPLPGGTVCGNLPPNDGRERQGRRRWRRQPCRTLSISITSC